MLDDWVIEANMCRDGKWCLIPVEGIDTPNPEFITGLSLIVGEGSFGGKNVRGVIHEGGQDEVERWCEENAALLEKAHSELKGPES